MNRSNEMSASPGAPEISVMESWLIAITHGHSKNEKDQLRRAAGLAAKAHAGQQRVSGEPYVLHSLAVAKILADLGLDFETLAAAILHDVIEDTGISLEDLKRDFGPRIAGLVDGVTKMKVIQEFQNLPEGSRHVQGQAENLRKMLLAMAEDVRVVLIKLADRLHNMRTLSALSGEKQKRIARETLDIFAPLANRLGIWQMKWELEDIAFQYLDPATYHHTADLIAEQGVDREAYIGRIVDTLLQELSKAGITAEVTGRPKHIYSIWRKMQQKGKEIEKIFDVRAVRVLVKDIRDCYAALGVVHSLWQHIPGEFNDYIATPKENNYRSIHTAVVGPEGKMVEIQIRTHEMHTQAEWGIAAHWRYKEGLQPDKQFDSKISWLRSLLKWKDEISEAAEFVDQFKSEIFNERIYVFTPKGNIVDLPAGSTPLDFAYDIHSDIGHRCRGAKVNSQMVPLTYSLKTGDRVEILTVKAGGPSRDWLSPHLGFLHTSKARTRVTRWFRDQNHDTSVTAGRAVLEREFHRLGIVDVNYEKLTQRFGYHRTDEFLAATGRGDVKPAQIFAAVEDFAGHPLREAPPAVIPRPPSAEQPPANIIIQGVGNLLTRMAKCCNPLPGDPIVGLITRGQGVTIHRQNCHNALRHHDQHEDRLIEVSWGVKAGQAYPVEVQITVHDRPGLLRDVTSLLANEKINVLSVNTVTDKDLMAQMTFTLNIPDIETLSRILALIDQVPNVLAVRRKLR